MISEKLFTFFLMCISVANDGALFAATVGVCHFALRAFQDCRCRYHVCFVDEGHRAEQKVMFMKLAAVIERIPNFGGVSYEAFRSVPGQSWAKQDQMMYHGHPSCSIHIKHTDGCFLQLALMVNWQMFLLIWFG